MRNDNDTTTVLYQPQEATRAAYSYTRPVACVFLLGFQLVPVFGTNGTGTPVFGLLPFLCTTRIQGVVHTTRA